MYKQASEATEGLMPDKRAGMKNTIEETAPALHIVIRVASGSNKRPPVTLTKIPFT